MTTFDISRRKISISLTTDPRLDWEGVTLWMQVDWPNRALPSFTDGQTKQFSAMEKRIALFEYAEGQELNEDQLAGNIQLLPTHDLNGLPFRQANLLGLVRLNQLKMLPPGDHGEAYALEILMGGKYELRAVFADSVGAARRWWEAWYAQSGLAGQMDASLPWISEQIRKELASFDRSSIFKSERVAA